MTALERIEEFKDKVKKIGDLKKDPIILRRSVTLETAVFLLRAFDVMREISNDLYLPAVIMKDGFDEKGFFRSSLQLSDNKRKELAKKLRDEEFERHMKSI